MMGFRLRMSWVTAWTRASARSGEWEGPRSAFQVHIWSSRSGKRPTWWTRPPYQGTGQALLVEGGDGFGADVLAASGADCLDRKGAVHCVLDGGLGHLAAGVVLYDYAGGFELVVEVDGSQRPAIRGETAGLVGDGLCFGEGTCDEGYSVCVAVLDPVSEYGAGSARGPTRHLCESCRSPGRLG